MVTLKLVIPHTTLSRQLPTTAIAERWGYKQILNNVPDCNQWKDCQLIIDGKSYPTTLQAVTKYRG